MINEPLLGFSVLFYFQGGSHNVMWLVFLTIKRSLSMPAAPSVDIMVQHRVQFVYGMAFCRKTGQNF